MKIVELTTTSATSKACVLQVAVKSKMPTTKHGAGISRFSVDVEDAAGSTMRIVGFSDQICEKFGHLFHIDCEYSITHRGKFKEVNPKFNKLTAKVELHLNVFTKVTKVKEEDATVEVKEPNYLALKDVPGVDEKKPFDVAGLIVSVGDLEVIEAKGETKAKAKRQLFITDESSEEVMVTLWNSHATQFAATSGQIVALRSAKLSAYAGMSIKRIMKGDKTLKINVKIEK